MPGLVVTTVVAVGVMDTGGTDREMERVERVAASLARLLEALGPPGPFWPIALRRAALHLERACRRDADRATRGEPVEPKVHRIHAPRA